MKFKQHEIIEEFPNKVLYSKCYKLTATVNSIAKLANIVANDCVEKLRHYTEQSTEKIDPSEHQTETEQH